MASQQRKIFEKNLYKADARDNISTGSCELIGKRHSSNALKRYENRVKPIMEEMYFKAIKYHFILMILKIFFFNFNTYSIRDATEGLCLLIVEGKINY